MKLKKLAAGLLAAALAVTGTAAFAAEGDSQYEGAESFMLEINPHNELSKLGNYESSEIYGISVSGTNSTDHDVSYSFMGSENAEAGVFNKIGTIDSGEFTVSYESENSLCIMGDGWSAGWSYLQVLTDGSDDPFNSIQFGQIEFFSKDGESLYTIDKPSDVAIRCFYPSPQRLAESDIPEETIGYANYSLDGGESVEANGIAIEKDDYSEHTEVLTVDDEEFNADPSKYAIIVTAKFTFNDIFPYFFEGYWDSEKNEYVVTKNEWGEPLKKDETLMAVGVFNYVDENGVLISANNHVKFPGVSDESEYTEDKCLYTVAFNAADLDNPFEDGWQTNFYHAFWMLGIDSLTVSYAKLPEQPVDESEETTTEETTTTAAPVIVIPTITTTAEDTTSETAATVPDETTEAEQTAEITQTAAEPAESTEERTVSLTADNVGENVPEIRLEAAENVIPDGAVLNVKIDLTVEIRSGVAYDITLTSGGVVIQPNGTVTVTIPVPEELKANEKNLKVFHYDGGKYTRMNSKLVDGKLVFTTDHFSTYVISAEDLDGETSEGSNPSTGVLVAIVPVLAAAAGAIVSKKRK